MSNNEKDVQDILDEEFAKMYPKGLSDLSTFVEDFSPTKDKYRNSLVAQGYVAARMSNSGSYSKVAKKLGLSYPEFKYYLETYQEFAAAIRKGMIDGQDDLKTKLEESLIKRASGLKVIEKTEEGAITDDGEVYVKVKRVTREIPPDSTAALAILRKYDATWNPMTKMDINLNETLNMNVTEDRTVNIDLRNLSPDALREILNSQQVLDRNRELLKREDGKSAKVHELTYVDAGAVEKSKNRQNVKGRKVSEETRKRMSEAKAKLRKHKDELKKEFEEKITEAYTEDEED